MSTSRARRAKFVPPKPSPWKIPRAQLSERLDDARHFPVTLISATAGSGKTTLMAEWVRGLDLPWGWLTLDDADASFDALLTNCIQALQTAAPGVGESVMSHVRLETDSNLDNLIAELDDDLLALDGDLVVVLDDAHTISDPRSIEFLQRLLQHPPPRLHLVLGARRDPPIPLARLRARGQLLELRAADLAFTETETRELLDRAGVSAELAASLERHTEGWVVGIHLAALALRRQNDGRPGARAVDEIVVAGVHDLIVNDILAMQPPALQRLLLVSSLVERFTADLCAVLLEDDDVQLLPQLQELAADGLLLFSLGGEPEWYRYHQIFRDVLRQELERDLSPEELAALHVRASAWFEANEAIFDALNHALRAGDMQRAIDILERHAQQALAEDRWPDVAQWLDLLPAAVIRARLDLVLAQAWVFQSRGNYSELQSSIDRATLLIEAEAVERDSSWEVSRRAELVVLDEFANRRPIPFESCIANGEVMIALGSDRFASTIAVSQMGFALIYQGAFPRVQERMDELLRQNGGIDDPRGQQRELWARLMLGLVPFLLGEIGPAAQASDTLLGLADSYHLPRFAAMVRYWQGWMAYERNDLDESIEQFEQVLHERSTGIIVLVDSTLGLARTLDAAGRISEADQLLQRLTNRFTSSTHSTYGRAHVPALQAERALKRGDPQQGLEWLERATEWPDRFTLLSNEQPLLMRVRILLATGRQTEAGRAMAELERIKTVTAPAAHLQIKLTTLRALHVYVSGDRALARAGILAATAAATEQGHIRSVLDMGIGIPAFSELLELLPVDRVPAALIAMQPLAPGSRADGVPEIRGIPDSFTPYEALTEREQDVADGLIRRLSYKEIAQELNISPLTVKSHSTHIYSKLGVTSRRQMIRLLEQ